MRFSAPQLLLALRAPRDGRRRVVCRRRRARPACTASCCAPTSRRPTCFHRTPSFAWNPVPGARSYQFQLSTSNTFRDNGIVYSDSSLTTPVAAPSITLPWITGSPHALYARVRARSRLDHDAVEHAVRLRRDAAGAAVAAAELPGPAPLDADRRRRRATRSGSSTRTSSKSSARTSSTSASSTRSISRSSGSAPCAGASARCAATSLTAARINGLPVAQYGAWSPVYSSTNPAVTRRADQADRHRLRRLLERQPAARRRTR